MDLSHGVMIVCRGAHRDRVPPALTGLNTNGGFNSAVGRWGQEPGLAVLCLSAECVLLRSLKREFLT